MAMLVPLPGCAYQSLAPVEQHFTDFETRAPFKNSVYVCSGYGCRHQTTFRFTSADLEVLQAKMAIPPKTPAATLADAERKAVARTLAWMEKRVGDTVGTSADRPGDDFAGNGDKTQMDCVDVATNLTSYLLVLEGNKLLKKHKVGTIFVKEDLRRGFDGWTHYAAILVEHDTKRQYAVDGWKLPSGVEPEIVDAEKWYIDKPAMVFRKNDARSGPS